MEDYRGGKTSKERMKAFKKKGSLASKISSAKSKALNNKIEMRSADTPTPVRKNN